VISAEARVLSNDGKVFAHGALSIDGGRIA
jgi:hypothetical protein